MTVILKSDLSEISSGISDEVKDALKDATEKMAEQARANAPVGDVDGGDLRDSIEVVEYNEPGRVGYRVVADARSATGKYNAPYAHMVEFGSVHNDPPRPFLIPALWENSDETLDMVSEALDNL